MAKKITGEFVLRAYRTPLIPPTWCLMESYNEASYAAPRPYSLFEGRNN